jgi:hypothetical protein
MDHAARLWKEKRIPAEARPVVAATLRLLRESRQYAEETASGRWAFAVELGHLLGHGSNVNVLRLLTVKGVVEHRVETTRPRAKRRRFQATGRLSFDTRTCFVLTDKGLAFAREIAAADETVRGHGGATAASSNGQRRVGTRKPRWKAKARQLWAGDVLVKQFQVTAESQRLVVSAFAEQRWRRRIDNPLPGPVAGRKKRAEDAVRRLNERQAAPLLRFHVTDGGNGLTWEWIGAAAAERY